MSKSVKTMMIRDYQGRVEGVENATLISLRGVSSNNTNAIRKHLRTKQIKITVVRTALARKAFEGTSLESLDSIMEGACALAFGAESVVDVARELVDLVKTYPDIELKGAVLDGMVFKGEAGVKELSKFPTREEAIGKAVTLILSPGRKLMGQVKGPGGRLMGIVKSIEDKLEKGESISKIV